jgi:hypothetical protein
MGEMKNVYKILVGKHDGKRPHGRPRRRWDDKTGMDLTEIVCERVDWMYLAQENDQWRALVNTIMNLRVP